MARIRDKESTCVERAVLSFVRRACGGRSPEMRRIVDIVVGNAPPLATEADGGEEDDVVDGGVREINARNGNAVVDKEAAT